jgi:small subunit ribosomal protein S17
MKIFIGKVIATKSAKTATVAVERVVIHPLYKKRFKRLTKFQVHDEIGVKVGDRVKFADCRPVSKTKKWKISEVIKEKKEVKK